VLKYHLQIFGCFDVDVDDLSLSEINSICKSYTRIRLVVCNPRVGQCIGDKNTSALCILSMMPRDHRSSKCWGHLCCFSIPLFSRDYGELTWYKRGPLENPIIISHNSYRMFSV